MKMPPSCACRKAGALVQTVDILSPIGNDPYMFGQIAAANALSDVYAMGGEPWCAMNIAFFPAGPDAEADGMTLDVLAQILRGGADKAHEAGAVLAGGHTVRIGNPSTDCPSPASSIPRMWRPTAASAPATG